jgi:VWFA-related protein
MMRVHHGFAAGVSLAAAVAAVHAQQPQFKSGVERILVDVQVIDGQGRPLENLGPGDFEVRLNRELRNIASVQFVRSAALDTPAGGQRASSPGFTAVDANGGFGAGGRDFIIAVDESSFRTSEAPAAIRAAQGFVEHLAPEDRVGLFTYPSYPNLFPLTPDHRQVWRQLGRVIGSLAPPSSRFHLTPLEVVDIEAGDTELVKQVAKRECLPGIWQSECIKSIPVDANSIASQYESNTQMCMNALRLLFTALGQDPQRKTVVIVSGGMFASDRVGGRPDLTALVETLGEDAARADANIYVLHLDSSFLNAFSASNVAGPSTSASRSVMRQSSALALSLDRLAGASGGTLVHVEPGGEDRAFQRILRETSAYYLLSVESGANDRDGRRHFISVKVKVPGADVRARSSVVVPRK